MNTTLHHPADGRLLVDLETGRVLFATDQVTVTERWANSHPFVERRGAHYLVGPDAPKAARQITNSGDYLVFEVLSTVAGTLTLQKVEDEA